MEGWGWDVEFVTKETCEEDDEDYYFMDVAIQEACGGGLVGLDVAVACVLFVGCGGVFDDSVGDVTSCSGKVFDVFCFHGICFFVIILSLWLRLELFLDKLLPFDKLRTFF
ncbi:hypothetical protein K4L44_06935 [Halosquirtibacter laminarini]|uniref:Uncharacterized protein n=1 Tax=Halosquirtibacter laminarini TaxID=3374600 RepID=A0AC61NIK9_9BACT|nr:hypothetical protein K4L44_06935 [Prolixibacteraceae bacterium]